MRDSLQVLSPAENRRGLFFSQTSLLQLRVIVSGRVTDRLGTV